MKRTTPLQRILKLVFTILVLLFIYAPVAWLLISSISTRADLLAKPLRWIPPNLTFQNYRDILLPGTAVSEVAATFKRTLLNSFIVAGSTTLICLSVGSLAAYALARLQLPFRRFYLVGTSPRRSPKYPWSSPLHHRGARRHDQNPSP